MCKHQEPCSDCEGAFLSVSLTVLSLFLFPTNPAGHHTIYIGVHVPKSYRRRRRHRRRPGHKERKERPTENASDRSDTENNDEASNSILKPLSE